jgi:hypothetical protein
MLAKTPSNVVSLHERTAPTVTQLHGIELWTELGFGPHLQTADEHKRPAEKENGVVSLSGGWTTGALVKTHEESLRLHRMKLNPSLRLGRIAGAPDGTTEYGAFDLDGEDGEFIRRGKEIVERKVGRKLHWRGRDGTKGQLGLFRAVGNVGTLSKKSFRDARPKPLDRKGNGVEILLNGNQCILDGKVVDRFANNELKNYRWPDGHPVAGELPEVGPELLAEIYNELRQAAIECGWDLKKGTLGFGRSRSGAATPRELLPRELLDREQWLKQTALTNKANILKWASDLLPEGRESGDGWEVWPDAMGRAHCQERLSIVPSGIQDWAQDWGDGRVGYTPTGLIQAFCRRDKDGNLELVDDFDENGAPIGGNVTEEDARAYLCERLDIDWAAEIAKDRELRDQATQVAFDDDFSANYAKEHPELAAAAKAKPIALTTFSTGTAGLVRPRDHLYANHYYRRFLSGTSAPGGAGKSAHGLVEAFAMASGRNLLNVRRWEGKPLRVLYWNAEDPQDENLRRGAAICQHYDITDEEIGGRLFLQSGREAELILACTDRGGFRLNKDKFDELERLLAENSLDVLMLDPFVGFHRLSENDNGAMGSFCYALGRVAERRNCAVEVIRHTRKPGPKQTETSVDDGRGASAVLAAMRSARVFNRMSPDEASKAGIHPDERWRYSRINEGKGNLAPPEKALWRRMASERLFNGPGGSAGDDIGVMEQWSWPDRAGGLTSVDVRAIQDAIAKGKWRSDIQTRDWAGNAVAKTLDFDASEKAGKARAKEILAALKEGGWLKVVYAPDKNGDQRPFVCVGKLNDLRKSQQTDDETGEEDPGEW